MPYKHKQHTDFYLAICLRTVSLKTQTNELRMYRILLMPWKPVYQRLVHFISLITELIERKGEVMQNRSIKPGHVWLDTNGNRIHAHGGSII